MIREFSVRKRTIVTWLSIRISDRRLHESLPCSPPVRTYNSAPRRIAIIQSIRSSPARLGNAGLNPSEAIDNIAFASWRRAVSTVWASVPKLPAIFHRASAPAAWHNLGAHLAAFCGGNGHFAANHGGRSFNARDRPLQFSSSPTIPGYRLERRCCPSRSSGQDDYRPTRCAACVLWPMEICVRSCRCNSRGRASYWQPH